MSNFVKIFLKLFILPIPGNCANGLHMLFIRVALLLGMCTCSLIVAHFMNNGKIASKHHGKIRFVTFCGLVGYSIFCIFPKM